MSSSPNGDGTTLRKWNNVGSTPAEDAMTIDRIRGPYFDKRSGRRKIEIWEGGVRRQTTYARWLVEQSLGRRLGENEHVDHIDDDKSNDDLSNLCVLTPRQNHEKEHGVAEYIKFRCPECGDWTERLAREVRHTRKQGKAGPFCGRSCAGRANQRARVAKTVYAQS